MKSFSVCYNNMDHTDHTFNTQSTTGSRNCYYYFKQKCKTMHVDVTFILSLRFHFNISEEIKALVQVREEGFTGLIDDHF